MRYVKRYIYSVLLYEAETWALRKSEGRMNAAEKPYYKERWKENKRKIRQRCR